MPPLTRKTLEEIYVKKTDLEHVLDRPDTYIGSVKKTIQEMYVFDDTTLKMLKKQIEVCPGLLKIFDEVLVNAIDHSVNNTDVTFIKIEISKETGEISVLNNGPGIPVEVHQKEKVYVPEMIFGSFRTSSNYDDTATRITGGLNGLGATCTNAYSKYFTIETVDSNKKLKYLQTFSDNMNSKTVPKVTKCSTKSYTKITFLPDYSRFGMKNLELGTYEAMRRRVYDTVATTNKNIQVYFNGTKLLQKTFLDFTKLFTTDPVVVTETTSFEVSPGVELVWEIAASPSESYDQVSFVNGVCTTLGGKHVDHIVSLITKKLGTVLETKKKLTNLKPSFIKDRLMFFVKATVVKPGFSSQSKECLTTPVKDFGIKIDVSDSLITKLYKSRITDDIVAFSNFKMEKEVGKATDGKKRNKINVPKLDDAFLAGTTKSDKCTLILTEGESAKTFALHGVNYLSKGKEIYGVFPLRGKLLNVREATQQQILTNEEILNLKKILGLQQGKKYLDTKELRYGSVMLLTDSDLDGSHIKGLVMNFFSTWWPELLEKPGFIRTLKTPIVKLKPKGRGTVIEFYTLQEYESFKETESLLNYKVVYYKGLGTSDKQESVDCFKKLETHSVYYESKSPGETDLAMKLAFEKTQADNRKLWLQQYDPTSFLDQHHSNRVEYGEVIHKELIHFSIEDLHRSIPSMVDGLKPSQRKILYGCFEKGLSDIIKVFQLGSYVAEVSSYHHGPVSLEGAIISMAQNFTGSNNINLLTPAGNFGTRRLASGSDHASSRYINTKLEPITKILFPVEDRPVLNYLNDDGFKIEPQYYIPLLPLILVNGASGIGTGFSTNCPPHNPKQVYENVKRYFRKEKLEPLTPWYRNFKGSVQSQDEGKYNIIGVYKRVTPTHLQITELPVGVWTDDYKIFLDKLLETNGLQGFLEYTNNSTDENIQFDLVFDKNCLDKFLKMSTEKILKSLKLVKTVTVTNMHLFDSKGLIKKYKNAEEIIEEFCQVRLELNLTRKNYLLKLWKKELEIMNSKYIFVTDIMKEKVKVFKVKKSYIKEQLASFRYLLVDGSYDYLINLPIHSFSEETLEDLNKKIIKHQDKIIVLEEKTETDIAMEDLEQLEKFI